MENICHIGLMKTGTTYVQEALKNNRKKLLKQGVLYPGQQLNHQSACYGLCGQDVYWNQNVLERDRNEGKALLDEIESNKKCKKVILSSEALSSLSYEGIERFVSKLGHVDGVVVTLRSLHRIIPSAWQQYVKGANVLDYYSFIRNYEKCRSNLSGPWRVYAYGEIVKRWSEFCDVNVILLPEKNSNPEYIWEEFVKTCALGSVDSPEIAASDSNISLNMESAIFLENLNKYVVSKHPEIGVLDRKKIVNKYLREFVFPLAGEVEGTRILPPKKYKSLFDAWNMEEAEKVSLYAKNVIGDIDSLEIFSGGYMDDFYESGSQDTGRVVSQYVAEYMIRTHL